jgi:phenylalanyl-tRNA synthetase beta chain
MANVKIPKKLFEKEVGKLDEKMQDRISMLGTPIDNITDEEFEVEIFPNRPDLLSYQGFKKAMLSFLDKKTGLVSYKINKPENNYKVKIDDSVKKIRPFTACAIVKNLKFNDEKIKEIIDIQEKLHVTIGRKRKKLAIGIYPLEKITLPITFKALEPDQIKFIPLEMDREMNGLQILQRHPTGREYAHLLAGKSKFPIFTDANNQILSMPPIINSHNTGKITEDTKDVFIECSGFDFEILKKCLNIIVTALADMGGQIYQMELDYGKKTLTPDLSPEKMPISIENTNKLLGLNLNEKQIKSYLERMGHNYNKGIVEIPAWRTDILHEVDLIEDVAVAYGYENLVPEIPSISTIGEEDKKETIKRKIAEILAGLNLLEVSNFHLSTIKDQFTNQGIQEKQEKGYIEVEASKTEYNILRKDLAHYILKNLSENVDSEYPQKIFESGRIFELNEKTEEIFEKESLAIAITPGNFTELKQILEYLSRMLSIKLELKEPLAAEPLSYSIDGRVAEILLDNKIIGYLTEVHPKILKNWHIKMPVALLEISLEELFEKLM